MTLAARLKARLSELALSQAELARQVGVAQPTIAKLISGASQNSKHLYNIANVLGTSPAFLLGETDDPSIGAMPKSMIDDLLKKRDLLFVPFAKEWLPHPLPQHQSFSWFPVRRSDVAFSMTGEWDDLRAGVVNGSGMEPLFHNGDVFVLDTTTKDIDRQDSAWLVVIRGTATLRYIQRLPNLNYKIYAQDPRVLPIEIDESELTVAGRVIWCAGYR